VVKIFFQKNVDIAAALAQVTAASQTVLKLLPPGITPPYVLSYNASSVPILQLALSSKSCRRCSCSISGRTSSGRSSRPSPAPRCPRPMAARSCKVQVDLDQQAMQAHNVSADDVVNAVSAQNLILPAGDAEDRQVRLERRAQRQPGHARQINDLPVKKVNGTIIYVRDVAYVHDGSPPQTNLVRVNGARAVLMTILKAGSASTLDVIDGIKSLLPRVEESLPAGPQSARRRRSVDLRQGRRVRRHPRSRACRRAGRRDDPAVPRQLALDRHHHSSIPLAILFSLTALSGSARPSTS
jgi:multidrug efflux pump subunit AcrB